jgi:hypothetical protein
MATELTGTYAFAGSIAMHCAYFRNVGSAVVEKRQTTDTHV